MEFWDNISANLYSGPTLMVPPTALWIMSKNFGNIASQNLSDLKGHSFIVVSLFTDVFAYILYA